MVHGLEFNAKSGNSSHNVKSNSAHTAIRRVKGKITPKYSIISLYLLYIGFALVTIKNSGARAELGEIGELVRIITLGPAYLLALIMIMARLNLVLAILSKTKLYLAFIVFCILSSFWSVAPLKVLLNSVHDVGYFMVGILLLIMFKERGPNFLFRHLAIASLILVSISIVVSMFFPRIGIHDSTQRWQGVAGNPNTLGMFCVICSWSLLMLYNLSFNFVYRISSLLLLGIPFFALKGGGVITSATSLVVTVLLCLTLPFFVIIGKGNFNTRVIKIIFGILFLLSGLVALYVFFPEIFNFDYVLSKMGRDRTMSGRTRVWDTGWKIYSMKPWLGWGFDALLSVMLTLRFDITQFHNGYLDLAIRGGLVGFLLLVSIIVLTYRKLIKIIRHNSVLGWGLTSFVTALLLHNVTDASFMRPTNLYWFTFLLVYMISCNWRLLLPIEKTGRKNA